MHSKIHSAKPLGQIGTVAADEGEIEMWTAGDSFHLGNPFLPQHTHIASDSWRTLQASSRSSQATPRRSSWRTPAHQDRESCSRGLATITPDSLPLVIKAYPDRSTPARRAAQPSYQLSRPAFRPRRKARISSSGKERESTRLSQPIVLPSIALPFRRSASLYARCSP